VKWSCLRNRSTRKDAFMSHANAALTRRHRLRLARLTVEDGWPPARARGDLPRLLAHRDRSGPALSTRDWPGWATGPRPVTPQHAKTAQPMVRKIVHLRWKQRLGPMQIGARLGLSASTLHAVLVRCHRNQRFHLDRSPASRRAATNAPDPGSSSKSTSPKFGNIRAGALEYRVVGLTRGDPRHDRQRPQRRCGPIRRVEPSAPSPLSVC
jgi:hypothetical protein